MSIQRHELKKKYRHVVYKRRIVMPEQEAMAWGERLLHNRIHWIGIG